MKTTQATMIAIALLAAATLTVISSRALAADEEKKPSADEVAKDLANPNTPLTSLKIQNQYFWLDGDLPGAGDLGFYKLYIQPTLPFPFENGYTLWVRPGIPVLVDVPVYNGATPRLDALRGSSRAEVLRQLGNREYKEIGSYQGERLGRYSGLGDVTLDVQYGTILENGFLYSIGFSSVFPTATEEELGSGQWALGPGFQLGLVTEKTIFGVFANHMWDIAGDGKSSPELPYLRRPDPGNSGISLTTIQAFAVVVPGGGWSFGSQPIMTYNWETEQWTVPLHLTVSKTFIINKRPWEISIDFNYYVERSDAIGPEWMVGINITPVVENIFATWFKK